METNNINIKPKYKIGDTVIFFNKFSVAQALSCAKVFGIKLDSFGGYCYLINRDKDNNNLGTWVSEEKTFDNLDSAKNFIYGLVENILNDMKITLSANMKSHLCASKRAE